MAEEKQTMYVGNLGCGCPAVWGKEPGLVTSHGFAAVETTAKEIDAALVKKAELHPRGDHLPHESTE